jgi:hypothetical protein
MVVGVQRESIHMHLNDCDRWRLFLIVLKAARTSRLMRLVASPFLRGRHFPQKNQPTNYGTIPIESILSFPWSMMCTNFWIVSYICPTSKVYHFKWTIRLLRKLNYRTLFCSSKHKQSHNRSNKDSLHPGLTSIVMSQHLVTRTRSIFLAVCFEMWCVGIISIWDIAAFPARTPSGRTSTTLVYNGNVKKRLVSVTRVNATRTWAAGMVRPLAGTPLC